MPTRDQPTAQSTEVLKSAVLHLLGEAQSATGNRRLNHRQAFFRPVDMAVSEDGHVQRYSCFSRDISPDGIGLPTTSERLFSLLLGTMLGLVTAGFVGSLFYVNIFSDAATGEPFSPAAPKSYKPIPDGYREDGVPLYKED